MPPPPSATWLTKLKVQLKLAIARLRMVQQRDEQIGKTNRRAMAQLLEAGKVDSATIRVEGIIRADITSELHELLELYCELLLARAGLLEAPACDPGLEEAVKSLVYAAPRTEIRELVAVRSLLAEKFGKEFVLAAMDNAGGKVSERVVRKLGVEPPRRELVQGYLEEIARAYGVDWPKGRAATTTTTTTPPPPPDLLDDEGSDGSGGGGGGKAAQETTDGPREGTEERQHQHQHQQQGEGLGAGAAPPTSGPGELKSPLTVTPPRMTTDNVHPKVTLGSVELRPSAGRRDEGGGEGGRARRNEPEGSVPDISDLERRFAALKRR
ncbi:IST1 -like protein [Escovopsis weberi]|uniref:IST1-like protein n=1 Tax=Escovopsis weberi TaxID=150374 RepID=A0A0M8MR02_ESCWE|nr:IST1 -like protein [Escovopsis weberi]